MPRRARYLVPRGLPRRDEILAACVVLVVLAHVLFAQLTIILAAVFYLITKMTRWRLSWLTVPAVAAKRVYLAPRLPFGWIDAPPSINRYIGLRWIARLLYPDRFPDDIHTTAREFFKLFYQSEPDDAALDRVLAGAQPGGRGR